MCTVCQNNVNKCTVSQVDTKSYTNYVDIYFEQMCTVCQDDANKCTVSQVATKRCLYSCQNEKYLVDR